MSLKSRVEKLEKSISPEDALDAARRLVRFMIDFEMIKEGARFDPEQLAREFAAQNITMASILQDIWDESDGVPIPPGAREYD
jgi:hypothetical protein